MSTELQVTDELTKAIQAAQNPADMTAAVQAEIQKQETAAADAAAVQAAADKVVADKAAADAAAVVNTGFSRTEKIGGKEFTFEADSELELERMYSNALKVAYAVQTPEARVVETVVDPAIAQKAAEDEAVAKVELELKFKRGEISAADYIEQSGAMRDYLAKQGVPLDALRSAVARNQDAAEEQSWEQATTVFLNSPAGADWPGGQKNLALMGTTLLALGLDNAKDKVAAYAQAYEQMKATNMIFPGEAAEAAAAATASSTTAAAASRAAADKLVTDAAVAEAARVASLAAATTAKTAATSSSLFGRSSGVGESTSKTTPAAAKIDIPNDATPAEIVDAWKKEQIRQGKDPNAAFFDTFSTRRA